MTWQDTEKALQESNFFKLKADGDNAEITFVGEPRPIVKAGKQGNPTKRYYISVYFNGEVVTWDCSKDTIGRIASLPSRGYGQRFKVTRHGKPDDQKTFYTFEEKPLNPKEAKWLAGSGFLEPVASAVAGAVEDDDGVIPF